jgi:alpha-galactosidase
VAQTLYTQMRDALAATGRPIVFSMCNGWDSSVQPQTCAQPVANLWRTTTDIQDNFASMLSNFGQSVNYWQDAGPGAWNDPDMLEIGNGGMTTTEYQSESGYYSTDGSTWTEVGSATVPGQAATQDAGLFMTSHATGDPGLVYFDGFSVS